MRKISSILINLLIKPITSIRSLFLYAKKNINFAKLRSVTIFIGALISLIAIIIGAYVNSYNTASQRYEAQLSRLQFRIGNLITQSHDLAPQELFSQISRIQSITLPFKPDIKSPASILKSFFESYNFHEEDTFGEIQNLIRRTRGKLNNLEIHNIVFSPILEDSRGTYHRASDFENSNFENSSLLNSMLIRLNLAYSNFLSTSISYTQMHGCVLSYSDFKDSNIVTVSMIKASLDFSDMSGAGLWYNNFTLASLVNSNLAYSTIENNNFQYAILLGTNLSKATISNLNDFRNALYNSQALDYYEHYDSLAVFRNLLKQQPGTELLIDAYNIALNKVATISDIKPTKFPEGFNPKEHGMIDIYETIEFIQKNQQGELDKYKQVKENAYHTTDENFRTQEESSKKILKESIQVSKEAYKQLLEKLKNAKPGGNPH